MTTLGDLASLIRSKNAGPFWLTFDMLFPDDASYERVRDSGVITRESIGKLYSTPTEDVIVVAVDAARAIKATIPRPISQGGLDDGDVLGGQQYAPLLDIEVP